MHTAALGPTFVSPKVSKSMLGYCWFITSRMRKQIFFALYICDNLLHSTSILPRYKKKASALSKKIYFYRKHSVFLPHLPQGFPDLPFITPHQTVHTDLQAVSQTSAVAIGGKLHKETTSVPSDICFLN